MSSTNIQLPPPPNQQATKIVAELCQECRRVHSYWQMLKHLFDENCEIDSLKAPRYEHFFFVIWSSLYESFVQGVARLHDRAVMRGDETLTINYLIEHIQWDTTTKAKLIELRQKMMPFAEKIKSARNKFTAHNDLKAVLRQPVLGAFDKPDDVDYFDHLEEFASMALGERFLFGEFVQSDVACFMEAFDRGKV
jgi:AbiU2